MLMGTDKRLALQAYEQILALILSGEVKPGDMLTERRIAEQLDMSRTPIRDALLMLEGAGLLIRRGTRGLQVRQMRIEDYMDALQIRLLVEPEAARLAAGRMPDDELAALEEILNALLEAERAGAGKPDRAVVRDVDDRIHGGIAEATGNAQLSQIVQMLRQQTQIFDLRSVPERLESTCLEHLQIVSALREDRGKDAAKAMKTHLERVKDSIIKRLSGA